MIDSPVLRLTGVTRRFGSLTAVDALDLDVSRGEFLTLLGPSGSGKSTILMMIAGFERPDAGEIWLDGAPQVGVPPHRRRIGVVFQNYALFPHLTVFENIAFALRNLRWEQRAINERVRELLALVQLEGTESRLPNQLSGGQQQRVALARALAFRPSLLLLDEPLGALDKRLREHMLSEFRRIHRTLGTTMLFVTHDQEEALAMSDRIAVMEAGRIVQIDSPRGIYEAPSATFVAGFIGDANLLSGTALADNRVQLEGGFEVICPHNLTPGTIVDLLLRPEHLSLGPGPNAIHASVEDRLYLGQTTKYVLRTGTGLPMEVIVVNRPGMCELVRGTNVTVSFEPREARILPTTRTK